MDPTEDELAQINNVQDALNWAGVDGNLSQFLQDSLGGVQRVREVALIPRVVWDRTVLVLLIPDDPDPGAIGPPNLRQLRPVEMARVESFRRVCMLRVGRAPDEDGNLQASLPGPAMPPFPAAGGLPLQAPPGPHQPAATTRKLKLSAVLDPTLDAEVVPLATEEVARMYQCAQ